MTKPRIHTRCVANSYAADRERIIEIGGSDGSGALISVRDTGDGLRVSIYRREKCAVSVDGPKATFIEAGM